ncbi:MAG: formylglycine-generating enzyme family protein [Candidatus Wallbacteria bacterium]|nr:formylglycine-generating enzyme family protein [Candidatus Wallbacteria bacterium]
MRIVCLIFIFLASATCFSASAVDATEKTIDIGHSVTMELVLISAGEFTMGRVESDSADACPAHLVRITRDFYLGRYEVTQRQWEEVTGFNPSCFSGPNRPVEQVSWNDCQDFVGRLNLRGIGKFRLPSEAEWEYACRAGTITHFYWGDSIETDYLWYGDNSGNMTHDVGLKKPNPWGLFDMLGNVREWCNDSYYDKYYGSSPVNDPQCTNGNLKVLRGGCFWNYSYFCHLEARDKSPKEQWYLLNGLRVVMEK